MLLSEAFGQANREKNVPNRPDTQFNLASVNKMFTAVAVAQLEEQGKLSFSDTVRKHLPNYPNPAADKITIRQLLTHTSGLEDIGGPRFFQSRDRLTSPQGFIDVYGPDPLVFEPGARWQYSNLGFIVLGRIIEAVSGRSYDDYVKDHIFQKAGMKDTGPFPLEEESIARARGYTDVAPDAEGRPGLRTPGKRFNNARYFFLKGTPAGYFFSTAPDLLRFSRSLAAGKLLGSRKMEEATGGQVPMFGPGEKYGYGFMEGHVHGARWFGHGGGGPGVSASFTVFPDSGYTVIVLANADPPAADWVAQRINDYLIFGR
jgi:CubicO group peptidase (beta-lactamase class C family)